MSLNDLIDSLEMKLYRERKRGFIRHVEDILKEQDRLEMERREREAANRPRRFEEGSKCNEEELGSETEKQGEHGYHKANHQST